MVTWDLFENGVLEKTNKQQRVACLLRLYLKILISYSSVVITCLRAARTAYYNEMMKYEYEYVV